MKQSIIIYGAGFYGLHLCDLLMGNDLIPYCILDSNPEKQGWLWNDKVKVRSPLSLNNDEKQMQVVVALADDYKLFEEVRQFLLEEGYSDICHVYEFANRQENKKYFGNQRCILCIHKEIAESHVEEIARTRLCFCDRKSLDTYDAIVNVLISGHFKSIPTEKYEEQYFAFDTYRPMLDEKVWDIGGGPTDIIYQHFCERYSNYASYLFVEPDDLIEKWEEKYYASDKINFYKAAVGKESGVAQLRMYNASFSLVVEHGDKEIEQISLNDLSNMYEAPTLVKIDAEGCEQGILEGGIELFKRCRPVIACACYHYESEFWELPLFLESVLDDYVFALRSYLNLKETVLYAIPKERSWQ